MFSDKKYLTASQLVPPGEGGSEQYSCSGGAAEAWGVDRGVRLAAGRGQSYGRQP